MLHKKNKTTVRRSCIFGVFVAIFALGIVPIVFAEETSVSNEVTVRSSSGGNSAKNGEVVEGKTTSKSEVVTVYNGTVVRDSTKESSTTADISLDFVDTQAHIEIQTITKPQALPVQKHSETVAVTKEEAVVEPIATSTDDTQVSVVALENQQNIKAMITNKIISLFTYVRSIFSFGQ
jgi:hypothetical protein